MVDLALPVATALLAAVLLAAGLRKLARPPDAGQMAALGLPSWAGRPVVVRLHAALEVVVGLALVAAPGPWLAGVALVALVMTAGYLLVARRAWLAPRPLGCHCFGLDDDRPVDRLHLTLNVGLVVASGAAAVAGLRGARVLRDLPPLALALLGALVLAACLTRIPGARTSRAAAPAPGAPGAGRATRPPTAPYLRRPIPAGRVVVDGVPRELTELATRRAQLLLRADEEGAVRERVLADLPRWQRRLPHLDVRVAQGQIADAYRRLGLDGAPSAVVLGTDGLLAGGPVTGHGPVDDLVDQLAGIAPTTT